MAEKTDHFPELEKTLTIVILADLILFIAHLVLGWLGLPVLAIILALVTVAIACFGLWLLINTREFRKPRSLWMTCALCSLILCSLVARICDLLF